MYVVLNIHFLGYRDAKTGKKQASGVRYLNQLDKILTKQCVAKSAQDLVDLSVISEAFNVISANVVKKAGEEFESHVAKGMKEDQAYEECSQARLYAAKIHSYGYLFQRFKDATLKAPQELKTILSHLCALYGLYNIQENAGPFLQYQYFTPQQVSISLTIDLRRWTGLEITCLNCVKSYERMLFPWWMLLIIQIT
jgi:acyl-CoA oxidase